VVIADSMLALCQPSFALVNGCEVGTPTALHVGYCHGMVLTDGAC